MGKTRTRAKTKGVSTLVATVLILSVVVTLVGLVAAWATGYLNMILGRSGVMITIENIEFREPGQIVVTVANKGMSDTQIVAVYVNDVDTTWSMGTTTIKPDQVGKITVLYDWAPDRRYSIKITTSGLFQLTGTATSPE